MHPIEVALGLFVAAAVILPGLYYCFFGGAEKPTPRRRKPEDRRRKDLPKKRRPF